MSQQREKEDTETLSPCTPSLQLSSPPLLPSTTARLIQLPSPSSGSDLAVLPEKPMKRKRENEGTRCSCLGCRKKLGLMGFRCRCGEIFCPHHRYSDRHDCGFDYKAAGKEAIARENPLVRAAKLLKV